MTAMKPKRRYTRHFQTHDLFRLQTEIIDSKVEVAVNKAINQVVTQIMSFRQEVHQEISGLRLEMTTRFGEVNTGLSLVASRLSSVEDTLGKRSQLRAEIRNRFIDYAFKAGWLILGAAGTYFLFNLVRILHS